MNEQSFFFRHVPTWGTAVAACITAALLVRMQPFYATADLARFAFTCALELALLDLLTRLALMPSRWLLRLPGLVATATIGCIPPPSCTRSGFRVAWCRRSPWPTRK